MYIRKCLPRNDLILVNFCLSADLPGLLVSSTEIRQATFDFARLIEFREDLFEHARV